MVEVTCRNVSVDTPKDIELARNLMQKRQLGEINR